MSSDSFWRKAKYLLFVLYLIPVISSGMFCRDAFSQEVPADNPDFKAATTSFLKGDLPSALSSSEKAYSADSANEKFRKLYVRLLVTSAENNLTAGKFQECISLSRKAVSIDPANEKAKTLLDTAQSKLIEKEMKAEKVPVVVPVKKEPEKKASPVQVKKEHKPAPVEKAPVPVREEKPAPGAARPAVRKTSPVGVPGETNTIEDIGLYLDSLSEETKMVIIILLAAMLIIFVAILVFVVMLFMKKNKDAGAGAGHRPVKKTTDKAASSADEETSSRKMITDPNAHVRAKGIELLEQEMLGSEPKEIEKTIAPLLDDPDNRVKGNAAFVIYKYNKDLALETLKSMGEDQDKWMRMSAAFALNKLGTIECMKLLQSMANDKDAQVQSTVMNYLFKNRPSSARKMLEDPIPYIREKGLELLEQELDVEDSGVAEKMLEPLLVDTDSRVRASACKVMHKFNRNKAFAVLREMTRDDDKWMRVNAAWILSKIDDPESIKILQSMSDDPDPHVQSRVLDSLLKVKATKAEKDEIYSKLQEKQKKSSHPAK